MYQLWIFGNQMAFNCRTSNVFRKRSYKLQVYFSRKIFAILRFLTRLDDKTKMKWSCEIGWFPRRHLLSFMFIWPDISLKKRVPWKRIKKSTNKIPPLHLHLILPAQKHRNSVVSSLYNTMNTKNILMHWFQETPVKRKYLIYWYVAVLSFFSSENLEKNITAVIFWPFWPHN